MREILFKAKRKDSGRWVEGLLWKKKYNSNKIFISCFPDEDDNEEAFVVDSKTICQYTGLTDKNGCKIWENDIVRLDEDLYIVTWEEDDAMFALEDVGIVEHFSNVDSKWCEVVGNKFDNPELLEAGEA